MEASYKHTIRLYTTLASSNGGFFVMIRMIITTYVTIYQKSYIIMSAKKHSITLIYIGALYTYTQLNEHLYIID
jgi:hypothetical protein